MNCHVSFSCLCGPVLKLYWTSELWFVRLQNQIGKLHETKEKAIVLSFVISWIIDYLTYCLSGYQPIGLADWLCRSARSGTLCFMYLGSRRSSKKKFANFFNSSDHGLYGLGRVELICKKSCSDQVFFGSGRVRSENSDLYCHVYI